VSSLIREVLAAAVIGSLFAVGLTACDGTPAERVSAALSRGDYPAPIAYAMPASAPLSAMAQLGKQLFYDTALSGSGRQSCASCHVPSLAYGPPAGSGAVMLGGAQLATPGVRAVPSLEYLYRQPAFSIGPENGETESAALQVVSAASAAASNVHKSATDAQAAAANLVPQGGMFWDGRMNTLQQQVSGPLFSEYEMNAGSPEIVTVKIKAAAYAPQFQRLFGPNVFKDSALMLSEALFAIGRYQIEDASFHPFSSKYDAWVQGKTRFQADEVRGFLAFNDPARGNCAACHLALPSRDRLPPLFTDTQFEALGVPRNPAIPANRQAEYADLGVCGPYRTDLSDQLQYCGMFVTPTLRNVATRHAFFHNGAYQSLQQVMDFYNLRDVAPQKIYPMDSNGRPKKFDDLPAAYRANIDTTDAPFNRVLAQAPAMSARDVSDIIAFLKTLNDGYDQRK
jgi:cytochrome c peroxidase